MSDKRPILTYEAQINRVLPGLIPEIREQVLADAKDRIEGLVHKEQGFDNADMEYGYGRGLAESIRALDALTQPQTEKCPDCKSEESHWSWCERGGAATAAGVADADLDLSIRAEAFKSYIDLTEDEEMVLDDAVDAYQTALSWEEPGPYAKAFRGRFPVPEFPGIKAGSVDQYPDHVAPVPQTEGECPDCEGTGKVTTTMVNDWLICPTCSGTGKEKAQ